ncbi:MAG TPA: SUF system NifU family Fe-S cluster assembly protein [Thermoanaerobaculia bacterium]|nr:SUF system NifU family Fe-S cluster assembly protein [Thermoanaerobaculia bacterium]
MSPGDELRDLYQDVILDHGRRPRNFGSVTAANRRAEGDNPLCGDHLVLSLEVAGDRLNDVAFEGAGCAISVASASLMTDTVKGMAVEEAEALFHRFHHLLTGEPATAEELDELGKLAVFSGVRQYPIRVKCATLPWHTLMAALGAGGETTRVSTE